MQKSKRHILSTRLLPEALIQAAAAQDIIIDEGSFIHTKSVITDALALQIHPLFQKPITAVFTSANAVTAVAEVFKKPKGWKVYSTNNTTARLVTELFKTLISGKAGNAEALADVMIKDGVKNVYFFCGNIRRDVLPQKLRAANIVVEEIVVYETVETPVVLTNAYDGILFYSPSAVHSFFSVNTVDVTTQLFAIGFTTAEAIQRYTGNPVLIADKTGKEDLVHQMIRHFNAQKRTDV
jgi:uroporphyrinogen-III synthase